MDKAYKAEALSALSEQFLQIADKDETRFIEASEGGPQIYFFAHEFHPTQLHVRFQLYDSLVGRYVSGEMEEFLYPDKTKNHALFRWLRVEFPLLDLRSFADIDTAPEKENREFTVCEYTEPHYADDICDRYMANELTEQDFMYFDEVEIPEEKKHVPLPLAVKKEFINKLHQNETTDSGKIILRDSAPWSLRICTNVTDDPENPTLDFTILRISEARRSNSILYQQYLVINTETQEFCDLVNSLPIAMRRQIIKNLHENNEYDYIRRSISASPLKRDQDAILYHGWPELLRRIENGTLRME